jgi:uncharacterized protein
MMIHPDTELRFVSPEIGYGVFATQDIPHGTVTYVKDKLEIEITPRQYQRLDAQHQLIVEKFSYIDERGIRIVSWDNAKYVNHSCECNTISTGYGFEIAIRDIKAGEEITDEYGLFNPQAPIEVYCGCVYCRKIISSTDIDHYHAQWDTWVLRSLELLDSVPQKLWSMMDRRSQTAIRAFLDGRSEYYSVNKLKWHQIQSRPACRTAMA